MPNVGGICQAACVTGEFPLDTYCATTLDQKKPAMPFQNATPPATGRDHGGGIDSAIRRFGGKRSDWLDLSTGINPVPYPLPSFNADSWTALPDRDAQDALCRAARDFWGIPQDAAILPVPGASAAIARIPALAPATSVRIDQPTYNEHAAAFSAVGWQIKPGGKTGARVLVHPNNPDGRLWTAQDVDAELCVIDESFCDVTPKLSLIGKAADCGVLVLKSFGKFWGLAGLRLGFVIGQSELIARLGAMIGPWAVSGPALKIGAQALSDHTWAKETRLRLRHDSDRLDALLTARGARLAGGTDLFRLYNVDDASAWHEHLARQHILTRVFPYSETLLRVGLPAAGGFDRLDAALA